MCALHPETIWEIRSQKNLICFPIVLFVVNVPAVKCPVHSVIERFKNSMEIKWSKSRNEGKIDKVSYFSPPRTNYLSINVVNGEC